MKSELFGKLTLGAVTSGSFGMMMYFINLTKNKKKPEPIFNGYDTEGYFENINDDKCDLSYYGSDKEFKKINNIQPIDISSKETNIERYSNSLLISDLDDVIYSNLTIKIPKNKYESVGAYYEYDDHEFLFE